MKLKLRKPRWDEKRASIRLELECPLVYAVQKSVLGIFCKAGKPVEALMSKPSMNGLRIIGKQALPTGTVLKLEVKMKHLGYDRSYFLLGKVMWSNHSGISARQEQGVRLLSTGKDQKLWEKFMLEQLRNTDRNPKLYSLNG